MLKNKKIFDFASLHSISINANLSVAQAEKQPKVESELMCQLTPCVYQGIGVET